MTDLSHCRLCGGVVRVALYPGWGNEPVKHECLPVALCHQCEPTGECQARTPCRQMGGEEFDEWIEGIRAKAWLEGHSFRARVNPYKVSSPSQGEQ